MIEQTPNFEAPIPGQSLTGEPKSLPFENPPQLDKVEDVIKFYISNMSQQETMDDIFIALEEGFPLNILVKSILSTGVMEGMHSIDTSLIVAPVVHEYIHGAAVSEGIKVKERPITRDEELDQKEKASLASTVERSLEKSPKADAGRELLEDALEFVQGGMAEPTAEGDIDEETVMEEEPIEEGTPMGLMARRGT
tara:strand:- start:359 stop:943 length:585 start_codon:yes stop_codon:yes gene_type:complete